MKYCAKCGKQLEDEACFCSSCGANLSDVEVTNNADVKNEQQTVASEKNSQEGVKQENKKSDALNEYVKMQQQAEEKKLSILAIVFAFVAPIVGIILGIVGLTKNNGSSIYRSRFILAIVLAVVLQVLSLILSVVLSIFFEALLYELAYGLSEIFI